MVITINKWFENKTNNKNPELKDLPKQNSTLLDNVGFVAPLGPSKIGKA